MFKSLQLKKCLLLLAMVMGVSTAWADYEKVTATADITDGEYLIVYETGNVAFDGSLETLDAVANTVAVTINEGKIASSTTIDAATFTIDVTNGTLKSASGLYIGQTSNSNGLKQSETADYETTFAIDDSNNAVITDKNNVTLRFNKASNQNRFRFYKSGQEAIQLYKKVAGGDTPGTVAAPTFSVAAGAVAYGTGVKLIQANAAQIIYTRDGSEPTLEPLNGTVYSSGSEIVIVEATTIKAIAVDSEKNVSAVASATYTVAPPAAPVITPNGGAVAEGTEVTIAVVAGTSVYYTTDGTDPTKESTKYENPITVNAAMTIKAIAYDRGNNPSEVATAVFTIKSESTDEYTVDILNNAFIGTSGTSYADFSDKQGTSGAVYAGNTAGGNEAIQMRTNYSNSGIVTTTTAGMVKKVKITWNSNTADARILDVYGSNTAYSKASELYDSSSQGTKIASFAKSDGDKEVEIEGDYAYVGFRSNSGALYVDEIAISWEVSSNPVITVAAPTFQPEGGSYTEAVTVVLSCETEGATILYTTDGSDPSYTNEATVKYLNPFVVNTTTTVKAVAILSDDEGEHASKVVSATYRIGLEDIFALDSSLGLENAEDYTGATGTYGYIVASKGTGSNAPKYYTTGTAVRFYVNNTLTVVGKDGKGIKSVVLTKSQGPNPTMVTSGYTNTDMTWTAEAGKVASRVVFNFTETTQCRLTEIIVTYVDAEVENATISDALYATFVPDNAVSFAGVKAYVAKYNGSYIELTEVTEAPAGKPVILEATAEGTYTMNVIDGVAAETPALFNESKLAVSDGTIKGANIYVLANKTNGVGFYNWTSEQALPAGKVYMLIEATGREFIGFGGEATGIESVAAQQAAQYYDLQGRRVAQPTKGLYIVNGKKMVVK